MSKTQQDYRQRSAGTMVLALLISLALTGLGALPFDVDVDFLAAPLIFFISLPIVHGLLDSLRSHDRSNRETYYSWLESAQETEDKPALRARKVKRERGIDLHGKDRLLKRLTLSRAYRRSLPKPQRRI